MLLSRALPIVEDDYWVQVESGLVGSGWVGSNGVDSDNRATSAQVQMKLQTRAELGKKWGVFMRHPVLSYMFMYGYIYKF